MKNEPFIQLENITAQINGRLLFQNTSWTISSLERWAMIGPNGSGKSVLIQALCRKIPVVGGRVRYFFKGEKAPRSYLKKGEVIVISPDSHQTFMKQYSTYHQARWHSFEGEDVPTVSELLSEERLQKVSPYDRTPVYSDMAFYRAKRKYAVELLDIGHLLNRKVLHLSHGESRKVQIARALLQSPQLIVCK